MHIQIYHIAMAFLNFTAENGRLSDALWNRGA